MQVTLASIDQNNAVSEAADYTYEDQNVPARVQQVCRHQRKTAQVSGRMMKDKTFDAIGKLKDQQSAVRMLELKRDKNHALINSQIDMTTESTATRFRGILEAISDAGNHTVGSSTTFSEEILKDTILAGVYEDGFEPTDLYVPPTLQTVLDGFSADNTRFVDVDAKKLVSHINVYDSPYGRVQIHLEREIYLDSGTIFALDRQWWRCGYFRRTWMEEPPKDGDRWRGVIQVDWALEDLAATSGYSHDNLVA